MVDRIVEPIVFPLLLVGLSWLMERNKSADRKADHERMKVWIGCWSFLACVEYALAWHKEIGLLWQSHPAIALSSTLAIFVVISLLPSPSRDSLKKLF
jgi:hypothetical protein